MIHIRANSPLKHGRGESIFGIAFARVGFLEDGDTLGCTAGLCVLHG
jgi:hypothetical protein